MIRFDEWLGLAIVYWEFGGTLVGEQHRNSVGFVMIMIAGG